MATTHGRKGRPWRRLRAQVLATNDYCYLCGNPVRRDVHHNHPLAPTVDHLVPLAAGGNPHELNNLAVAHRSCNSRKGTKRITPRKPRPTPTTSRTW